MSNGKSETDGDWSAWAEVDRARNNLILENVPEVESDDRMPEQVRLPALIDLLPFLKRGSWIGADVEDLVSRQQKKNPPPFAAGLSRRHHPPLIPHHGSPQAPCSVARFQRRPGFSYRYRVRIVIDSSIGVGQRRELIGPWSEPTAPVTIPEDLTARPRGRA